jgi:hypothetical protein
MLLSACRADRAQIRYRLTVDVETPEGLVSGSSVIDVVKNGPVPLLGRLSTSGTNVDGEAVAIDLPNGKTIYALLFGGTSGQDFGGEIVTNAIWKAEASPPLPRRYSPPEWPEGFKVANRLRPTFILPPELYPLIVYFDDDRDPRSVRRLDPENSDEVLGAGGRIRSIRISVTDAPVTRVIERRLPWLGTTTKGYLSGKTAGGGPTLAHELETSAFKRVRV